MSRPGNVASLRVGELARIFTHRYGSKLPDDDAGRDDVALMLSHLAHLPNATARMNHFLELRAPWMNRDEREAVKQLAVTGNARWNADELAMRLGLNFAERTALRITTIGAIDADAGQRAEIQKAKHRERERVRRQRKAVKLGCPELSERERATYHNLHPFGWHALSSLLPHIAVHPAFSKVPPQDLRKVGNRALKALQQKGFIKLETRPGARGLQVLFATRDSASHSNLSPGTLTGTLKRAMR